MRKKNAFPPIVSSLPVHFPVVVLLSAIGLLAICNGVFAQGNRLWATYYGSTGEDFGQHVATDASGNVYLAGYTLSSSGIASGGFQSSWGGGPDAFLVKFNSAGARQWATYYGGASDDYGISVATDASGNVFLAGYTTSSSGIAFAGFDNTYGGGGNLDGFLVKFNATTGARIWATYYGGTGYDYGACVATDASGNVYLAGMSDNSSGIASGGFQNAYGGGGMDAFLVKFDAAGARLWATYYGGAGYDTGNWVDPDAAGNVYLSGSTTTGTAGIIAAGGFDNTYGGGGLNDGFLVKFNATTGARIWATYCGGAGDDYAAGVSTDASNNVYLAGNTSSTAGIASGGVQNTLVGGGMTGADAFLVKYNAAGARQWGTYYGSSGDEEGYSAAVNAAGNVFLAGDTYNPGAGLATGGFQNSMSGTENEFLVMFDANGNRLCATYYGQDHDEQGSVAVDVSGNVYLAGAANSISGIAFNGFDNTYGGAIFDAYLVKFSPCPPLAVELISLTAKSLTPAFTKEDAVIMVQWSTSSQTNNDYFTVERSINGIDWEAAGTIDGAGQSSAILNYIYIDSLSGIYILTLLNFQAPVLYYHLRQTDFNGRFTYSQIVSVIPRIGSYPRGESISIHLYDITGRKVLEKDMGRSELIINTYRDENCNLSQGIYYVKQGDLAVRKLIIP